MVAEGFIIGTLPIQSQRGFERRRLPVGGIDTNELSSKTMEGKIRFGASNFIGEVVAVTGWMGGDKFPNGAWASGFAAGNVRRGKIITQIQLI